MGMPSESSQQPRTLCSYQHSPGRGSSRGVNAHNHQHGHNHGHRHNHPHHHPPHAQHLSPHATHNQHQPHQHTQHGQHSSQHTQHPQHRQHPNSGQQQSQHLQSHTGQPAQMPCTSTGLSADWYPNLDWLKESCRIAGSYNWADVDLSPFQGKKKEYFTKTNQWEPQHSVVPCTTAGEVIFLGFVTDNPLVVGSNPIRFLSRICTGNLLVASPPLKPLGRQNHRFTSYDLHPT
uniref:Uncharacterized protein n=1 Tax=Hucho hucho TaxID=62062 RepID=A0A4W5KKL8_9TELE